jgi:hypothetical protein
MSFSLPLIAAQRLSQESLTQTVLTGMAPHEEAVKRIWKEDFPDLVSYLSHTAAPLCHQLAVLEADLIHVPQDRSLIITGECWGGDLSSGEKNTALLAAMHAAFLLKKYTPSPLPASLRQPSAEAPFLLVFSGGVRGNEAFGEIPSYLLRAQFETMTDHLFASLTFEEGLSINTGMQGRLLASYIQTVQAKRVIIALPMEHAARFAATIASALQDLSYSCSFFFVSVGAWDDKDPNQPVTKADIAFGPKRFGEKSSRVLGAEYTERYYPEQDPTQNKAFLCKALSPKSKKTN